MEREARLFGCIKELENDVLRYVARIGVIRATEAMKPHKVMQWDDGKVYWILIEDYQDINQIAGLEFSQVMFDLSFPHDYDCVRYCMTRLRGQRSL